MSIRKSIGKIAGAGGLITLLYGSGCVDPPKNGQYYTKAELDNQREIRNIVSLGGFLFDFAAPISTNPAKAFAVGSAINTANNVAGYNDPLKNQYPVQQPSFQHPSNQSTQPAYNSGTNLTMFSCSTWVDTNCDGKMQEDELTNKKNIFNISEQVILAAVWKGHSGTWDYKVSRNSDSKIVASREELTDVPPNYENWLTAIRFKPNQFSSIFKEGSRNEEYKIEWMLNSEVKGMQTFMIVK